MNHHPWRGVIQGAKPARCCDHSGAVTAECTNHYNTLLACVAQVQLMTLCVSVSLSATVALVCLFGPKLHVIAFQSHKNVRKLTMNAADTTAAGRPQLAAAAVEMAATAAAHSNAAAAAAAAGRGHVLRSAAGSTSDDSRPRCSAAAATAATTASTRPGCFRHIYYAASLSESLRAGFTNVR